MLKKDKTVKVALILILLLLGFGCIYWWKYQQQNYNSEIGKTPIEWHEVKANETLLTIATKYGISVTELREENRLLTDEIQVGMRLHIPLKPANKVTPVKTENFRVAFDVVNVYQNPSNKSEMVTQALYGEPIKILHRQQSWAEISLPEQFDYRGWVEIADLRNIPIEKDWKNKKIVAVAEAKVRNSPSHDAAVFLILPLGAVVGLDDLSVNSDFTAVQLLDGKKGYILSTELLDYFSDGNKLKPSSDLIIKTAQKLLGQPYLWGGMTTFGVDCSGFIHTVFKVHGIKLHRDVNLQYVNDGIKVDPKKLQPGDLVFFETYTSGPSHIGIYVGNRKFLNSASHGVNYNSLDEPYFSQRFIGAKRILNSQLPANN